MAAFIPDLDPSLIDPSLRFEAVDAKIDGDTVEEHGFDKNENRGLLNSETQAVRQNPNEESSDMVEIDPGNGLGIDLMGSNDEFGSKISNFSAANHGGGEYSEQEYSERVSDDEDTSTSEYSDEEDLTSLEEKLREVEDMQSAQSIQPPQSMRTWNFDGAPLELRSSSPQSPPSHSPPPTPVLRLAPLFPPGVGMPSAATMAFFDNPIRYATRINARKVRVHHTYVTVAENQLRQMPGMWWRRISKVPTSLRRCWTPYDMFDEHLDNTLVAIYDYGTGGATMNEGAEMLE